MHARHVSICLQDGQLDQVKESSSHVVQGLSILCSPMLTCAHAVYQCHAYLRGYDKFLLVLNLPVLTGRHSFIHSFIRVRRHGGTHLREPSEKRPRQYHAPQRFQEILRSKIEAYVASTKRIPPVVITLSRRSNLVGSEFNRGTNLN